MTINQVMQRTDWRLLSKQKLALIHALNPQLEGLLNWIDAIQDAAEKEGFPVVWLSEESIEKAAEIAP